WTGALFLLASVVLGAPPFGAKFGGIVASVGGFGLCFLRLTGLKIDWRHWAIIAFAAAAAIAMVIVVDRARGTASSHVGRAFASILRGGWSEFGLILQRKGSMNLRLLAYSPWSRLMGFGGLACILGLWSRRSRGLPTWPDGAVGSGIAGAITAAA